MPRRKNPLVENRIYHVVSRSIAGYKVFRGRKDYQRMKELMVYYQIKNPPMRYSLYVENKNEKEKEKIFDIFPGENKILVEIIAYCLMPTHIHLVLYQTCNEGISVYMRRVLNSYTRYFNLRMKRKGPLWEGRFRNVEVETDEQLYHLTRYVHLNPVTAELVKKPEEWQFSSYTEYINTIDKKGICSFSKFLNIEPKEYKKFVLSRIEYQKELAKIKSLFLE